MSDLSTYANHMGRILKVLVYIEEHFDQPLLLEEMAKIARISPYYFHRLFHAYVGETVAEYIKRLRVQRAKERLQYSNVAITEIALEVGYETPSSFTKIFHQVMGQSPREYRQLMQPMLRSIMERTNPHHKTALKPEYVNRKDETVLFVRKIGDYNEAPWQAFAALEKFLEEEGEKSAVKAFYSTALDDPNIVDRSKCRFDACVALSDNSPAKGEVGQKILRGGRFAVFTHFGSYCEIEDVFMQIFSVWYPTSKARLADRDPFCEYVNLSDGLMTDPDRVTKFYIPLAESL